MVTGYAATLKAAGLADRIPPEVELRHCAIELLAQCYAAEDVEQDLSLIEDAIEEARGLLDKPSAS
jgi:hypothetical protein